MKPELFLCFALGTAAAFLNQAAAQTIEVTSTSVGIGTANPGEKLEINGNVSLGSNGQFYRTDVYSRLWTPGQSIGSAVYAGLYGPALTYNAKLAPGWKLISGGTASSFTIVEGRLVYSNSSASGSANDAITWSDRFVVEPNGNVGVGTTSPGVKLDVAGSVRSIGSTAGDSRLILSSTASGGQQYEWYNDINGTGTGVLGLYNRTSGNVPIVVTAAGNVGIGTTPSSYKFQVDGSVRATSFIANTNTYADFVFKPGYKLASLSEVEAAIKTHGHLPDIPSEAEAKARGIDLAAMQVKLLQKVEELTLYLVAHDKELKALRTENAALREQISTGGKR